VGRHVAVLLGGKAEVWQVTGAMHLKVAHTAYILAQKWVTYQIRV